MSRKVLFFDIDGTLFSEVSQTVPESARAALKKAQEKGHLIIVNTGRSYAELGGILKEIPSDGWACGCGTYVEVKGEVLYHRTIPSDQARRIKDAILACNMDGFLEGKEGCYVHGRESRFPEGNSIRQNLDFAIGSYDWNESCGEFEKFCLLADDQSDRTRFFRELGLEIDVIDRGNQFYECVPTGHSKATAVDVVLEHYGIPLKDAYVFGDSTNDLSMFEYVPNAILMGKHDKELEPFASFVTKHVEQDGIWYAMETLGLM